MIRVTEQTILLVSDDAELWAAARREFEAKEEGLRVTTVSTLDAARRIMEAAAFQWPWNVWNGGYSTRSRWPAKPRSLWGKRKRRAARGSAKSCATR